MSSRKPVVPSPLPVAIGNEDRKQQDHQHVIHHGCAEQGDPFFAAQHAQFEQGLGRDADARGGQQEANGDRLDEGVVEGQRDTNAHQQRHDHAQDAGQYHDAARAAHLIQVRLQPGEEHEEDDADLRQLGDYFLEFRRSENRPGGQVEE